MRKVRFVGKCRCYRLISQGLRGQTSVIDQSVIGFVLKMNRREFIRGAAATLAAGCVDARPGVRWIAWAMVVALCASAAVSAVQHENPVIAEGRPEPSVRAGEEGRHETNAETGKQAQAELSRIAVFGGSFSRIKPSAEAKDAWAKALGCTVDTYGVNGCGFEAGRSKGDDVGGQVKRALASGRSYKAFVLWASGNDYRYPPVATSNGVERAVALIREKAPKSKIVLLNSIDEPFRDDGFRAKLRACAEAQAGICAKLGVPVLDLHGGSGITKENGRKLVGKDDCHMTAAGYRFIAPMTTEFLVRNLKKNGAWEADDD